MSEELQQLLEISRSTEMTPQEREEQRISFAYGNTHFENEAITRSDVEQAAQMLRQLKDA